jgi:hypothetical protein
MRGPANPHSHSYLCGYSATARANCLACKWASRYKLDATVYEFNSLLTEADKVLLREMLVGYEVAYDNRTGNR